MTQVKNKYHKIEDLGTSNRCFICSEDPETLRRLYPDLAVTAVPLLNCLSVWSQGEHNEKEVLKRHCNGAHDLYSWVGFYSWLQSRLWAYRYRLASTAPFQLTCFDATGCMHGDQESRQQWVIASKAVIRCARTYLDCSVTSVGLQ